MIKNIVVQLYPYSKISKKEIYDLLDFLKTNNIKNIELTSEIHAYLPGDILKDFNVYGTHTLASNKKPYPGKTIYPSIIFENDFIFPLSLPATFLGRSLNNKVNSFFLGNKYRRTDFSKVLKTRNYFDKEFWIELACWLNTKNDLTLHNHSYEIDLVIKDESPWTILNRYLMPHIRFQFDPQNVSKQGLVEKTLINYHNRIDSLHLDLDSPVTSNTTKNILLDFSREVPNPIDIVIEQRSTDKFKLMKQIEKIQRLI